MAGLLQTGTISRYNTAESHSLMHYSQLCGTHQPRLCALELLPKEFTGGISDDPCRALHSNAARPRHTCAALITLLPNSLTWLGEPVAYGKDVVTCICNPAKSEAKRVSGESSIPVWGTVTYGYLSLKRACNPI